MSDREDNINIFEDERINDREWNQENLSGVIEIFCFDLCVDYLSVCIHKKSLSSAFKAYII